MKEVELPKCVRIVNNLSIKEKLIVYMDYYVKMITLKYNFELFDKSVVGLGKVDKEYSFYRLYYLWKNIMILSFDAFINENNVIIQDMGIDWEKNGRAQRYRVELNGIYSWYQKNK